MIDLHILRMVIATAVVSFPTGKEGWLVDVRRANLVDLVCVSTPVERTALLVWGHFVVGTTFMDHGPLTTLDESRSVAPFSSTDVAELTSSNRLPNTKLDEKTDREIALIESRTFMRDCIHRGLQAALPLPIVPFSTLSELESHFNGSIVLFLLSLSDTSKEACANALKILAALDSNIPIVVLATVNDRDLVKTALNFGAKGYIPHTTKFDIAIEAVRFILAGGTYVPVDYLFTYQPPGVNSERLAPLGITVSSPSDVLTDRERSVVQAIQEGKSNKVIAYKLCICEGTVKVHLRNIMKKMHAKNRTEVAIKAQTSLGLDMGRVTQV